MVFAFARDGGLPWSSSLATIDTTSSAPFKALCFSTGTTALFGSIFLISNTAFNVIAAASVLALSLSYALPVLIHCLQGRPFLAEASFRLSASLGWLVNSVRVVHALFTSMMFSIPPTSPTSTSEINFGGVFLLLMLLFCGSAWLLHSQDTYNSPCFLEFRKARLLMERSND